MKEVDDGSHLPLFLMFVPAVIISSFLFDRGSGFFAVALSSIIGTYFFVEPAGTFDLTHVGEVVRLTTFVVIGLLTASIIEALRKAVDELGERTLELNAEREAIARNHAMLQEIDEQKTLLLSDLNHRVKNHLQSIIGIISLSSRQAQTFDDAQSALQATGARLQVLGRVYDRLQLHDTSATVDGRSFVMALCSDLKGTMIDLRAVSLQVDADSVDLDSSRAVSLGLIINELVTNALKYAFPGDQEGDITVELKAERDQLRLEVRDNGVGIGVLPEGSTGQRLVRALARQLGGHATWTSEAGTRVEVTFPAQQSHLEVY
jgi:two-component sensor histidine kinase